MKISSLSYIIFIVALLNSTVFAQDRLLGFEIYTIQASGTRQSTANVAMSSALTNYKEKLLEFPFDRFQLVHSSNIQIPIMKREQIVLDSGEKMELKASYCESGRAGLWLQWLDQDGAELINTRLHFDQHEPVIVGAEKDEFSGRLLMVRLVDKK